MIVISQNFRHTKLSSYSKVVHTLKVRACVTVAPSKWNSLTVIKFGAPSSCLISKLLQSSQWELSLMQGSLLKINSLGETIPIPKINWLSRRSHQQWKSPTQSPLSRPVLSLDGQHPILMPRKEGLPSQAIILFKLDLPHSLFIIL
jgi:hypothetical protein